MSSANRKNFKVLEEIFMSLIYRRKSIGPNILPCGTPHVMNFSSERMLPTFTTCLRFVINKIQTNLCLAKFET